jgi:Glyoxalase-like domain
MALGIHALCFDALDPRRLAHFWAGILDWEAVEDPRGDIALLPSDDTGFRIRFLTTREPKAGPNRMHFDLTSSSLDDQQQRVARVLELGGRHIDVGQLPDEEHVVLADPEGNELCVIGPGNDFLADCGLIGAVSSDGTQEVGYFWSAALEWALVWDRDEETAIRAPYGGPKITWGGPPVAPKLSKGRLHFDLAPPAGSDHRTEVERLVSLGARHVDIGQEDVGWVVLADPDGNEFCVVDNPGG